jgi:hypothetical protein
MALAKRSLTEGWPPAETSDGGEARFVADTSGGVCGMYGT